MTSSTPPTSQDLSPIAGARLLLVEDNELNQEIALELLNLVGMQVDLAVNGQEALDLLRQNDYDLVFMDLKMPVLDGISATRIIRRENRYDRLPIVAMTANAMISDREDCLAVGMNDFIAKPIAPENLWAALLRWVPPRRAAPGAASPSRPTRPASTPDLDIPGLDSAGALHRLLGNRGLYAHLLCKFAETQAEQPQKIQAALADDDWPTAERLAHSSKGAAASIGALEVQARAAELEQALRERRPPQSAGGLFDAYAARLSSLIADLRGRKLGCEEAGKAGVAASRKD